MSGTNVTQIEGTAKGTTPPEPVTQAPKVEPQATAPAVEPQQSQSKTRYYTQQEVDKKKNDLVRQIKELTEVNTQLQTKNAEFEELNTSLTAIKAEYEVKIESLGIDKTLLSVGIDNELVGLGIKTKYLENKPVKEDGTSQSFSEWLDAFKTDNGEMFKAPASTNNVTPIVKGPHMSNGMNDKLAKEYASSSDPAKRQQARDYLEAKMRGAI